MALDFDILEFLSEPLRPASVATVTASGCPALATMWYLFEDGRFWFHTPDSVGGPFVRAARHRELVSVMVDTFDPVGDIKKVRTTGPAAIAGVDQNRVTGIYDRYLGPAELWTDDWRQQVADPTHVLWSVEPSTGGAIQYPKLSDAGAMYRWATVDELLAAARSFQQA